MRGTSGPYHDLSFIILFCLYEIGKCFFILFGGYVCYTLSSAGTNEEEYITSPGPFYICIFYDVRYLCIDVLCYRYLNLKIEDAFLLKIHAACGCFPSPVPPPQFFLSLW